MAMQVIYDNDFDFDEDELRAMLRIFEQLREDLREDHIPRGIELAMLESMTRKIKALMLREEKYARNNQAH